MDIEKKLSSSLADVISYEKKKDNSKNLTIARVKYDGYFFNRK
jgi:hypothetical protein